jgi:diguanylate cyclase (GGDEF)-like protein/PAS domain S-box-containing protein
MERFSAYLGAVLEGIAEGVLLTDAEGRVVHANRALGEILGIDAERLVGSARSAFLRDVADRFVDRARFLEATRDGRLEPFRADVELIAPRRRLLRWSAHPAHGGSGHAEIVADVTAETVLRSEREVLARIDPITGLGNRRAMEESIEREVARASRSGSRLSMVNFRVDRIDRLGPGPERQAALRAVARIVVRALRGSDVASLWDDGEVVALLPATGAVGARALAERVRAQVERLGEDERYGVTVSCGVAELHDGERGVDAVERARARARDAQQHGGNRLAVL